MKIFITILIIALFSSGTAYAISLVKIYNDKDIFAKVFIKGEEISIFKIEDVGVICYLSYFDKLNGETLVAEHNLECVK